ncbi:MAG: type VII secretion protein EssC [Clostridium sp.]|nr:type VII secretion protein EssC [Clostridium sp.]
MLVTLIIKNRINTTTLPQKVSGQYWLSDTDESGNNRQIIGIEGIDGQWYLKSNRGVKILAPNNGVLKSNALLPLTISNILLVAENCRAFIFTEPITQGRQIYKKAVLNCDARITIGRSHDNTIVFNNNFVSSHHSCLEFSQNQWSITDLDSTNGTFVNGYRIKTRELVPGDTIYIIGFKIIIGTNFIAFNNPDGSINLMSGQLSPFKRQAVKLIDEEEYDLPEWDFFYRSPRFKRGIEELEIKVDSPPSNAIGEEIPLIFLLGPSMTMGMAFLSSAFFSFHNAISRGGDFTSVAPTLVMSVSMLLGTVLWPILTKRYEKKKKYKKEALRQEKYTRYLDNITETLNAEYIRQKEILFENYVHIEECIQRIENVQRNLWERSPGQDDFLRLRVGLGDVPMSLKINYSERKFSLEDDNLTEDMHRLCEAPKILEQVPITLSLFDNYISGIIGKRNIVKEFCKGLIIQLTSLYSYDEVKTIFIYDSSKERDLNFVKWLPHVWSNDKKIRFIACNQSEVKEISAYMENVISERMEVNDPEMGDVMPYYIVFALSKSLSLRAEMLNKVYSEKRNLNISIITFFDELKDVPKECSAVVELDEYAGKIFDKNDISGQFTAFEPDIFIDRPILPLSKKLANVRLDILDSSLKLPTMITFLELFGVGKVEHLNSLSRWKENDPTKNLEAAVGVDTYGGILKLDLHEKFHGPHGLIAGMTGSGKSEFIITYILSLAVNYHPYEVAFILIDYKGGGMAKAFKNLPHTMGIITNLDGASVKRSLISIESELLRRQEIFARVTEESGISNIDIYKYQMMYREGSVKEPIQHVFIISDEFAELKTQQPEFMQQLISAARIGRSLGVHLILATQKPSGVVDDQIWSNSKFRVCLKVQERSDSMDMLKRPEAAELANTGRFYLQVGYNEIFELGQSAWAGAPYYPSEGVQIERDKSIIVIDRTGRPIKQMKIDNKNKDIAEPEKQLDVITKYMRNIAQEEKIKIRPLWLEPIPEFIYLDNLKEKYSIVGGQEYELNPVIGEFDDPARQRQCILRLPISKEGNTIVYGAAESGKTTFLTTMVYSLLQEHTPDEVNIYILDFSSQTLKAFSAAPHVGDVILPDDTEKVNNTFKYLFEEIQKRKRLFADDGGDIKSYRTLSGKSIPSIVVVINNFAAFTEIFEEKEDAVSYLSREGTKYGIYFVLTATGTNAVRFRLLQNFKQLIAMQLNDETEYSSIVGKTNGLTPSHFKGRGIIKRDALYEFQIAYVTTDKMPLRFIQGQCKLIKESWKGSLAKRIPILPEYVDLDFISDYVSDEKALLIPIGVEKDSLEVHFYPFGQSYINLVLSATSEYIAFVYALSLLLSKNFDVTVFDILHNYKDGNHKNVKYYSTLKECESAIEMLFDEVVYRHNMQKEAQEKGEPVQAFEQKIVVLDSISELKNALSEEGAQRLSLILEKGQTQHNLNLIASDSIKGITGVSFDPWYKKHITQSDGIWIGNGISEQYQLKLLKTTREIREEIGKDFGFSVKAGKPVRIKVLKEGGGED